MNDNMNRDYSVINNSQNMSKSDDINNNSNNIKKEKGKRRIRKLMLLLAVIIITMIVLITGTYAWFVGITSVTVSEFDIKIGTTEGIQLSLDANNWVNNSLTISQSAVTTSLTDYPTNTNKWVKTGGLSPVSTSGDIDESKSRLKFFEKTSLSTTGGGYRLTANKLDNTQAEIDHYITFDLFVRNGRSDYYEETYNDAVNESIYLVKDSSVRVSSQAQEKGLRNSIRIAFAQIGRIKAYGTTKTAAQAITCRTTASEPKVTGLCSEATAGTSIWEPNDKSHTQSVIDYFNRTCRKKTVSGETVSYNGNCTAFGTNDYAKTFAVKQNISVTNLVDLYDGLNNYNGNLAYLEETKTITDTNNKTTDYDQRKPIFKLAPNSVTKIRVYVYLEGQDVDNYDLITQDTKVTIAFGITKDKYEGQSNV